MKGCLPANKTLHILTHYITKTEEEIRDILTKYMLSALEWLESISHHYSECENVSLEGYIDNLATPGAPFDLLAIFVLAQLYHFHVRLFHANGMWCTSITKNMSVCQFVLLFQNRYEFDETFEGGYYRYQKSLEKNTRLGLMPSHLMDLKDGVEDIVFLKEEKPKRIKIKSEHTTEIKKELRVMIKCETSLEISAKKLIAKSRKGVAVKVECNIQRKAITTLIAS